MRFLGLVFFVAALGWTWSVMHASPKVSFETHAGIQEQLAGTIIEILKKNKPTIANITVDKMWTEVAGDETVKAHFAYSFSDSTDGSQGIVRSSLEGEALLKRKLSQENEQQWELLSFKTQKDNVTFEEPLYVNPNREEKPSSETKENPKSEPSEPATH